MSSASFAWLAVMTGRSEPGMRLIAPTAAFSTAQRATSESTTARLQKGKFAASAMPLSVAEASQEARWSGSASGSEQATTPTRAAACSGSSIAGASSAPSTTMPTGTPERAYDPTSSATSDFPARTTAASGRSPAGGAPTGATSTTPPSRSAAGARRVARARPRGPRGAAGPGGAPRGGAAGGGGPARGPAGDRGADAPAYPPPLVTAAKGDAPRVGDVGHAAERHLPCHHRPPNGGVPPRNVSYAAFWRCLQTDWTIPTAMSWTSIEDEP